MSILIQSPYLHLSAAGSTGANGYTKANYLRWLFRGFLGRNHLPKGDYTSSGGNFNRVDDYVRIYRTPYCTDNQEKQEIFSGNLSFQYDQPNSINHKERLWSYTIRTIYFDKLIYLRFLENDKYDTALSKYSNPYNGSFFSFFQYYFLNLHGIIEIETPNDLFFSVKMETASYGLLKTEIMSVNENKQKLPKYIYSRKTYDPRSCAFEMICENGRSIRLQAAKDMEFHIESISFCFYDVFIKYSEEARGWDTIGDFALSLEDGEVLQRLEPVPINGNWPRFNDDAFVKIENYISKWKLEDRVDGGISEIVHKYIEYSNDENNPKANVAIESNSGELIPVSNGNNDQVSMSLLDLLNSGAMDFHIARMLGLGTIDYKIEKVQQYIYIAEYISEGDLKDGKGFRKAQHLYLSLPTSTETERLPKVFNISGIVPGITDNIKPVLERNDFRLSYSDGYTYDGRSRFVTILVDPEDEDMSNPPFYISEEEFDRSEYTLPIFGGLEHMVEEKHEWQRSEISYDPNYKNYGDGSFETVPLLFSDNILINGRKQRILYVHKQQESGTHDYLPYGIDIFSRSTRSDMRVAITTLLKAKTLKPPVNVNALLIPKENPLMFTSEEEQNRYNAIQTADKTLIRLTFDYHTEQELSVYKIDEIYSNYNDSQIENNNVTGVDIYPNDFEIYADEIEIFFRNSPPKNVAGKAVSIQDNVVTVKISTDKYKLSSQGEEQYLTPTIPASEQSKYAGGIFSMEGEQFLISSINAANPNKPEIYIYKKEIGDAMMSAYIPEIEENNLQLPKITSDGLFMIIENMQSEYNWVPWVAGIPYSNPITLKVKIGTSAWDVKREVFHKKIDNVNVRFLEKSRGIWQNVNIEKVMEVVDENANTAFGGLYKLTFNNFKLSDHPQYSANNVSVEWYNGIVRIRRNSALPNGERETFRVVRMDNSGTNLVLYISDSSFSENNYDGIAVGSQLINYYPGYKVYLYANGTNLTESKILPADGEDVHYSIFGLRSKKSSINSKISAPTLMFAQKIVEPVAPDLPKGVQYATRPDFFGKASYTITPVFAHKPDNILFCRSNDELFLNALYEQSTIANIRLELEALGGNDEEFFTNRWENFLDFKTLKTKDSYKTFPETNGYAFPIPDNKLFIQSIENYITWSNAEYKEQVDDKLNDINSLKQVIIPATNAHSEFLAIDFIREVIYNSFVPLTEIPIIFQHIKSAPYKPLPKKQNIRNKYGDLILPTDPEYATEFDMAPMAAIAGDNSLKVIFTDFTLDGTSRNVYFYGVKEMNLQMKSSDFGDIVGPVKLINSNPPEAPEIKRVMPVLGNSILGIAPAVQFEINSYPKNQYVRRITIYRALNGLDAQSVRTMTKVKDIDIDDSMLQDDVWTFVDDFADLEYNVPFGTPLCYRITVSRKVEYAEGDSEEIITEFAPSNPSKILATLIPDTSTPDSPVLDYSSGTLQDEILHDVVLNWNKTVNNGKYYIYKMNSQGNWVKIKELAANNDSIMHLRLADTDLASDALQMINDDGQSIYHQFKALAENSSGLLSSDENILTIIKEKSNDNECFGTFDATFDSTFDTTFDITFDATFDSTFE